MRRLKKSNWWFWLLVVLGLGTCVVIVVMTWKLIPRPSVIHLAIVILGLILGLTPLIQVRRLARKEGDD